MPTSLLSESVYLVGELLLGQSRHNRVIMLYEINLAPLCSLIHRTSDIDEEDD